MPRKKTEEDYHKLASEKGFEWVANTLPVSVVAKTLWRCPEGHEWETTYNSIDSQNSGCHYCSGNAVKTIGDYHAAAKEKGFKFLDDLPQNTMSKARWECSNGHVWETTYTAIYSKGRGCPHCARTARITIEDYHLLGSKNKLEWIGEKLPLNTKTETWWRCLNGHHFLKSYRGIQFWGKCTMCSGYTKSIDDYHNLAKSKGIKWIGSELPSYANETTEWECVCGTKVKNSYYTVYWKTGLCRKCAYAQVGRKKQLSIKNYIEIGKEKNFYWLGKSVPRNVEIHTSWQCLICGHKWEASYHSIRNTDNCPVCVRRINGERIRLTAEDYHNAASQNGLTWIGDFVPQTSSDNTLWKCEKEHIWEARYANIKHKKSGCPYCINMINGRFISSQQESICEMIGGELNIFINGYAVDIVLYIENIRIAIEYDGWYWHKDKLTQDFEHSMDLVASGWRVLRIKSGALLPQEYILHEAIAKLCGGSTYEEIILEDWGE